MNIEFGIKQILTVVTIPTLTDSYISYIVRTVHICVVATCLAVALPSVAPGLLCTSLLGAFACAYM